MDHDLERFVHAQAQKTGATYEVALAELSAGAKTGHWIWWILPQLLGLGDSPNSVMYGITSLDEAREYASHPVLGPRLRACARAVLAVEGRTAERIMGGVTDARKLQSSMTLFEQATGDPVFAEVIEKHFDGQRDKTTQGMLS